MVLYALPWCMDTEKKPFSCDAFENNEVLSNMINLIDASVFYCVLSQQKSCELSFYEDITPVGILVKARRYKDMLVVSDFIAPVRIDKKWKLTDGNVLVDVSLKLSEITKSYSFEQFAPIAYNEFSKPIFQDVLASFVDTAYLRYQLKVRGFCSYDKFKTTKYYKLNKVEVSYINKDKAILNKPIPCFSKYTFSIFKLNSNELLRNFYMKVFVKEKAFIQDCYIKKLNADIEDIIHSFEKESLQDEALELVQNCSGSITNKEINSFKEKHNTLYDKEISVLLITALLKTLEDNQSFFSELNGLKEVEVPLQKIPSLFFLIDRYIECQDNAKIAYKTALKQLIRLFAIDKKTPPTPDFRKIKQMLDESHLGLEDVKTQLLKQLAFKEGFKTSDISDICLIGPPGVGKTTIAKSIAKALNRPYAFISLEGQVGSFYLQGESAEWKGCAVGAIMQEVLKADSFNLVILLDEIDKIPQSNDHGSSYDVINSLLNKEQAKEFTDCFLEMSFDLSKVLFILTANDKSKIPSFILNRLKVIELQDYSKEEKRLILKNNILPKMLDDMKDNIEKPEVKDEAINKIVELAAHSSGIRTVRDYLADVLAAYVNDYLMNKRVEKNIDISYVEKNLRIFKSSEQKRVIGF